MRVVKLTRSDTGDVFHCGLLLREGLGAALDAVPDGVHVDVVLGQMDETAYHGAAGRTWRAPGEMDLLEG